MINTFKKIHFGVYGIAQVDGQILMIKKSRGPYTGLLDLPGGRVEPGESLSEALAREIDEETGGKILSQQFLDFAEYQCTYVENGETKYFHHVGLYFLIKIDATNLKSGADGHDSNGAVWVPLPVDPGQVAPIVRSILTKENPC